MRIAVIGTISGSLLGFRASFISKLIDEGNIVYALAMDYDDLSILKIKELGAIPVKYSMRRYGLNPFIDILNTFKLAQQLRHLKVDVVFCYFAKPVIYGGFAASLARVNNRVGMLEGLGYAFTLPPGGSTLKQKLIRFVQVALYRSSVPLLNKLVVLNPDDKQDLLVHYKVKAKHCTVLGGIGLDLKQYPYAKPAKGAVNFIFIGRLLAEKGIIQFLDAAERVKAKFPHVTFTVLGDIEKDSSSSVSLDRLAELCKRDTIEYPGQVSCVLDWLMKCSVFVLPSYYREGVPRSTQEAMAIGRPVITTDVPGCRETVVDGRTGFLIPPHNVDALVEKMVYFIEHPESIEPMGWAGHQYAVEHFDVDKVNQRLYDIVFN